MSLRPEQERLAGWGNFPIEECAVYRPENRAELEALRGELQQRESFYDLIGKDHRMQEIYRLVRTCPTATPPC